MRTLRLALTGMATLVLAVGSTGLAVAQAEADEVVLFKDLVYLRHGKVAWRW